MTHEHDETLSTTVQCDECKISIPKSAAITSEGKDYTWHFCGPACYEKWQNEHT